MVLGTVLILAALSLLLWNKKEATEAEKASMEILPKIVEAIEERIGDSKVKAGEAEEKTGEQIEELSDPFDTEMTVVEIDGYSYIGFLSIPSLNLELPVMAEWDYKRLKIAPCRYSGSVKSDDLVIAGHNYARHFSPIKWMKAGEQVQFTDMDGRVWEYQVGWLENLKPEAVERMIESGENHAWDLTLFTCTTGGAARCAVRCIRK